METEYKAIRDDTYGTPLIRMPDPGRVRIPRWVPLIPVVIIEEDRKKRESIKDRPEIRIPKRDYN